MSHHKRHPTTIHTEQIQIHPNPKPRHRPPQDQAQSPFFAKFPLEIRRLVYTYTLLDDERERDHEHEAGEDDQIPRRHFLVEERHFKHRFGELLVRRHDGDGPRIWGPILTCWRMYHESIPILYSEPTLDFTSDHAFLTFISFTPSTHLRHIRRVNLDLSIRLYRKGELWLPGDDSSEAGGDALTKLRRKVDSQKAYLETVPSPVVYRGIGRLSGLRELGIRFRGLGYQKGRREREGWDEVLLEPVLGVENEMLERVRVVASWEPVRLEVGREYWTKSGCPFRVEVDRTMFRYFAALLVSVLDWEM